MVGDGEGAVGRLDEPVDAERCERWNHVGVPGHGGADDDIDVERGEWCGSESSLDVDTGAFGFFV